MDRVYFITAFWEVDWTDNPITRQLLIKCGNAFKSQSEALGFLQSMKHLREVKEEK